MKHALLLAAVAAASVALSGCTGVGNFLTTKQSDDTIGAKVLSDIQGCKRTYGGSLGPAGIQGSFNISCDPQAVPGLKTGQVVGESPPQ